MTHISGSSHFDRVFTNSYVTNRCVTSYLEIVILFADANETIIMII